MSSRKLSRETKRRRAIPGGTTICSRCDQLRARGSTYCRDHRNEYLRAWRSDLAAEIKRLKAAEQELATLRLSCTAAHELAAGR